MNIAVIGMGYVGLSTAISLAEAKNNIIAIEKDKEKLKKLKNGISPIYEPNIQEYIEKYKDKIKFVSTFKKNWKEIESIFICVGTPENDDGSVNLKYLYEVIDEILNNIEKSITIIVKSTVPVGTNRKINEMVKNKLKKDIKIEIVSIPEFLSQGSAIYDAINPQRIVVGINSKEAIITIKDIYKKNDKNYIFTDPNTAELIKYACNSFLAMKISYINEMANLCKLVNANIRDLEKGMKTDRRIGKYFLESGVGYGGSCLPKDTKAICYLANQYNCDLKLISATININNEQKTILVKQAKEKCKTFSNMNIAILGLAFKPNTDDLRDAPSLDNIEILLKEGATIKVYDPKALENLKRMYSSKLQYSDTPQETLKNADICFIFTEWKEIKNIKPLEYKKLMRKPLVYDGRNMYDLSEMRKCGIEYYSI